MKANTLKQWLKRTRPKWNTTGYPEGVRRAVARYAEEAYKAGTPLTTIAADLGIMVESVRRWTKEFTGVKLLGPKQAKQAAAGGWVKTVYKKKFKPFKLEGSFNVDEAVSRAKEMDRELSKERAKVTKPKSKWEGGKWRINRQYLIVVPDAAGEADLYELETEEEMLKEFALHGAGARAYHELQIELVPRIKKEK